MILGLLALIIYVGLSIWVGWRGRNRTVGFAGFFVLSMLLTPLLMSLVLLISGTRSVPN